MYRLYRRVGMISIGVVALAGAAVGALIASCGISIYRHGRLRESPTLPRTAVAGGSQSRLGRLSQIRLRRFRLVVLTIVAVVLVGVPTVFTIWPSLARSAAEWRALVLVAWILVAVVGAILTARADDELHRRVVDAQAALIRASHRETIREQFRAHLSPGRCEVPEEYHLSVYGPSPDRKFLVPLHPSAVSFSDPAIFPVGCGAVGRVWSGEGDVVVLKGEAVSSDPCLTELQSHRYAIFQVVAATVIKDATDTPVGALGAIAREDTGFFDSDEGLRIFREVAESLEWLLPKAVHWMMPTSE